MLDTSKAPLVMIIKYFFSVEGPRKDHAETLKNSKVIHMNYDAPSIAFVLYVSIQL